MFQCAIYVTNPFASVRASGNKVSGVSKRVFPTWGATVHEWMWSPSGSYPFPGEKGYSVSKYKVKIIILRWIKAFIPEPIV